MAKLTPHWDRILTVTVILAWLVGCNIFARFMNWRLASLDDSIGMLFIEGFIFTALSASAGVVIFFLTGGFIIGIIGLVKWMFGAEKDQEKEGEELSHQQERHKKLRELADKYYYYHQQKRMTPEVNWSDTKKCEWCGTSNYLNNRCTECGAPRLNKQIQEEEDRRTEEMIEAL